MKYVLIAALAIAGCSSKPSSNPHAIIMNGFDFPIVVALEAEGGGKQTLEIAPRTRVNLATNIHHKTTIKVTTKSGELMSDSWAHFGSEQPHANCYYVYNVLGAAAWIHEDVVYGTGFGTPQLRRRAGSVYEQECGVSFAFRDPPKAITVNELGPAGDNRGWMHYDGDGGWVTAVNSLLDQGSGGAAQRIVRAVVTHDASNPALAAIKARLTQMKLAVPEATPGNLLEDPRARKRR